MVIRWSQVRAPPAPLQSPTSDLATLTAVIVEVPRQNVGDSALFGAGQEFGETLARKGVRTREDLADLAVDELVEMGGIDEKKAAELIMDARKHWFAEEAKTEEAKA